jgi:ribosome-binding ATPase YchF (GTP1/OBG family)
MALQCGIVGLPTSQINPVQLFVQRQAQAATFRFAPSNPTSASLRPDERLNKLAELGKLRIVPTTVKLSTSPDWSKGAARRRALGNKFWPT